MAEEVLEIIGVVVLAFVVLAGSLMLIIILSAAQINRRNK
jgi:hypothetical protein